MRAPSTFIIRFHVAGLVSCIVRATMPPIEWASMRTGVPVASRASSAASTASARRAASSSIGRRQSNANGMTSWSSDSEHRDVVVEQADGPVRLDGVLLAGE